MNWEKVFLDRYNHLLVAEFLILAAFPILQMVPARFPLTSTLILLAIVPSLRVVLSTKAFRLLVSVGLFGYGLNMLARYGIIPHGEWISVAVLTLDASFFLAAIIVLLRRIASQRTVTAETVKGGIAVYFLIGMFFMLVYVLLMRFDPDAFANAANPRSDLFYYSFVTLTTLGFGDITPACNYAKSLAIFEAFIGQIYLAVFIAQLVGMRLSERLSDKMR